MTRPFSILAMAGLLLTSCAASVTPDPSDGTNAVSSSSAPIGTGTVLQIDTTGVRTEDVQYATMDGTQVAGTLALPPGEGPHPALILIHEWWGLNDDIRAKAREFAAQGYAALAVDLYEGKSAANAEEAGALAGTVRGDTERAFQNLRQAVDFLKARPDIDDARMASVGWCFGGGWSYQMAKNDLGVRASVMYYGQFDPEDDFEQMKAHIIGHFGENDESIPVDDVRTFRARLDTAAGDHEVYIYPNAGHGFANPDNDNFNPDAARAAWARTVQFLNAHVRDAEESS